MYRRVLLSLSSVLLLVVAAQAQAGGPTAEPVQKAGDAGPVQKAGEVQKGGGPQYVQKTICVPEWITEMRTVCVTQYRQESREVMETIYHCQPEQHEVERRCTIMVPQTQTKMVQYGVSIPVMQKVTEDYTVCVPVYEDQVREYTVMVPHLEKRQGVRRVCQMVTEQVPYTVCVDRGHWAVQTVEVPCVQRCCVRRCGHCKVCCHVTTQTVCRRVWVPNIVQETCMRTVCRPQWSEVPCEYTVTVCKPETRTCTVRVCRLTYETHQRTRNVCTYETEMREREVCYTVCVPQEKVWTETVTTYRQVPEQVTRTVMVCVPEVVEKQVPVRVCRMVQKTVTVPVCPPPCGGC